LALSRLTALSIWVSSTLEKVFGTSNVHSPQHNALTSGDKGEVDALVRAEWPLVVEAKAIALPGCGRRGYTDRVDKKLEGILGVVSLTDLLMIADNRSDPTARRAGS
jgi:hypothetical protein